MKRNVILLCVFLGMTMLTLAQQQPLIIGDKNSKILNAPTDWHKFVKEWDYVQLETNDKSKLERIDMFYVRDNYIVVKDIKDNFERVMLFTRDGKFKRRISSPGPEKEQHGMLEFVRVDDKNKQVTLCDGTRKKSYVTYNYDGEYLGGGDCGRTMFYIRDMRKIGDNRYLGYTACGLCKMCYFITDSLCSKYDTLREHRATFPMGAVDFSISPVAYYRDNISCLVPLCDTIFSLEKNKLKPRYIFEVRKSVPKDFDITTGDYLMSVNTLRQKYGIHSMDEIFETERWFIVVYRDGKYFIDKKKNFAYFIPKELPLHSKLIYPHDLWGKIGERIVAIFSADELLELRDHYKSEGIQPGPKLQELFSKVKKSDNPWLLSYELTTN